MSKKFGLSDSNACKGIAIILMLVHHLFYSFEVIEGFKINESILSNEVLIVFAANFGKVCVAIFVFLTAFGTTMKYSDSVSISSLIHKYVKIELSFIIIYITTFILSCFTTNHTPYSIYGSGARALFYIIIDALGLASFFGQVTLNPSWWYMAMAILLIFVLPILIKIYDKFGMLVLPVCLILPKIMGFYESASNHVLIETSTFSWYILIVFVVIYAARRNLFSSLHNWVSEQGTFKRMVKFTFLLLVGIISAYSRMYFGLIVINESVITVLLCFIIYSIRERFKYLHKFLEILRLHSMNIYLIHTILFMYLFKNFIYSFSYPLLIIMVLLLISLLVSIVIEWFKKVINYKKIVTIISEKSIEIILGRE